MFAKYSYAYKFGPKQKQFKIELIASWLVTWWNSLDNSKFSCYVASSWSLLVKTILRQYFQPIVFPSEFIILLPGYIFIYRYAC